MNARNGCLIALLALASACALEDPAESGLDAGGSADSVAPAIIAPSETAEAAQPPSYEVSIASSAADHNRSLERCAKQPESVRTQCQQEANVAFAEAERNLEPLRGNPE